MTTCRDDVLGAFERLESRHGRSDFDLADVVAWPDLFDFDRELEFVVGTALEDGELDASAQAVVDRARRWAPLCAAISKSRHP